MPLPPSLFKTWQHAPNLVEAAGANGVKRIFLAVKNALKGFALNPWTVMGSSDAVTAGMDGVDRLTDVTKVVNGFPDPRSWIVLRQASGLEFCLAFDNGVGNYWGSCVVSRNGFGAVNGGTNGTTTARPTATDQIVLGTSVSWGPNNDPNTSGIQHVLHSEDGLNTVVVFMRAGLPVGLWALGQAELAVPGWVDPLYAMAYSTGGTGSVAAGHLFQTPGLRGWAPSGVMTLLASTWCIYESVVTPFCVASNVVDSVSGEWLLQPMGLYSPTTGARGRHGVIPDLYYVGPGAANGLTLPLTGGKAFAVLGDIAVPWNGVDNAIVT